MRASGTVSGHGAVWPAAVLSGALLAGSFPPLHLLLPPFVALVPFAARVASGPAGKEDAVTAARGGLVLGLVAHGALLHWTLPALWRMEGWVALPLFVVVLGVLAGLTSLVGWALHRAVHGSGVPLWLALPVVWTAGEWAQAHLPGTLAFPWLGLGTALTGFPELVGIAELVGARGAGFWLATVNGLLASALIRRGRRVAPLLAGALVLAVPMAWGVVRAEALEMRDGPRVLLLQTDAPAGIARDPERAVAHTLGVLERLGPTLTVGSGVDGQRPAEAVDVAVLPEGAVVAPPPSVAEGPRPEAPPVGPGPGPVLAQRALAGIRLFSLRVRAPVLVGWYEPGPELRNTAVVVGGDGRVGGRYRKRRLVPFVEADPWMVSRAGGGVERAPPRTAEALSVDGRRFGFLICYESAFAELSKDHVRGGAEVLLNLTNDAWYGGDAGVVGGIGMAQHPAHLVMRVIETRRGAVRVANAGPSFFVDPVGRVHDRVPRGAEAAVIATVRTTDTSTLYERTGDGVGLIAFVLAAALAAWGTWSGSRLRR